MTDWWAERRQNQELEALRGEMSYARQETSRLQSQLSRIQGGLQERVNRLSTAFDAFVELSDLRYEMAGFVDAAELRRYATQVLTAMASSTDLPPVGEPVPQYWLGPAVETLIALNGSAPDDKALSTAMRLDERRTSIFLVLALAALGQRHQVRTEWLDVAFGVPAADGTLTRVQRVLWATAARGGCGAGGLELVVKRLQSAVPPEAGWLSRLERRGEGSRPSGPKFEELAGQQDARTRLTRIRSAVESIAGNTEAREPDPTLGKSDSAASLLRLLISEGSDPERESLARAAVLRARITGSGESSAEGLQDPVGKVEELLGDDLGRTDDQHLPAAALRVIGPSVLAAVDDVAKIAARPSPPEIALASENHTITIRPGGPDQVGLAKAVSSITDSAGNVSTGRLAVPAVPGAAGLLMAIGLGFVHPLWIALGLILIGIGAHGYWKLRRASKHDKADAAARVASLTERCTTAATQLADYAHENESRQADVAADLTTIRRHLTA